MARWIAVALAGLVVALFGVDLAMRVAEENRLEARLNARKDIDNAVLRFESWPYTWHARKVEFPDTTLSLTLKRRAVYYDPLVLHLRSLSYAKNDECPSGTRLLVRAIGGDGMASIHQSVIARALSRSEFVRVAISPEAIELTRANGTTQRIEPSGASIRPDGISGDIVLRGEKSVLIELPEPVDGVKFQEVEFQENRLVLPFTLIDPELFCT